uniref:protein kinase C n=1 Tax=Rhodnius prolixus TaxID=13249 RepID=T1HA93_RHOPR
MNNTEITFIFQFGLIRDTVTIDTTNISLKLLKEQACEFINDRCPEHGVSRLNERLLLFRHDYTYPNILQIINCPSDITDETLVEIVLSAQVIADEVSLKPHTLTVHSFKSPTFCDLCGEMLFGLVRQGLKCEGCSMNFHKRCVVKIPNNCSQSCYLSDTKRRSSSIQHVPRSTSDSGSNSSLALSTDDSLLRTIFSTSLSARHGIGGGKTSRSPSLSSSRTTISERSIGETCRSLRIPHTFVLHSYTRPTVCVACKKLLKGLFKQGMQCKDCHVNAHKKCTDKVPKDCKGEHTVQGSETDSGVNDFSKDFIDEDSDNDGSSPISDKETSPRIVMENGTYVRKRHYWRLDSKSITLFQNDTGTKYYKEINLSEILSICPAKAPYKDIKHCFEIRTAQLEFYVGEDINYGSGDYDAHVCKSWENAIRQALMPVTTNHSTSEYNAPSLLPEDPCNVTNRKK